MESKRILWFAELNKYLITAPPVDHIVQMIWQGSGVTSTVDFCIAELNMVKDQATALDHEIRQYVKENIVPDSGVPSSKNLDQPIRQNQTDSFLKKYYQIFGIIFYVEFETAEIEELLHPKFAHLETAVNEHYSHHFIVFTHGEEDVLQVNGMVIGSWQRNESHLMTGKFAMEIIQRIYHLNENKWMGVFHAAGVTDGKNCLVFLGESGKGKSTLSAILMANGLDVLADDFLPVESESQLVCSFPAALSVKKQGYELLIPKFPELQKAKEFYNSALNKTFRYLPPFSEKPILVPCKALIFVKFDKNSDFYLEPMTHEKAFQQLVPDSWISPEPGNANKFINWFLSLPCYEMTYSDNEKMVQTVKHLLCRDI